MSFEGLDADVHVTLRRSSTTDAVIGRLEPVGLSFVISAVGVVGSMAHCPRVVQYLKQQWWPHLPLWLTAPRRHDSAVLHSSYQEMPTGVLKRCLGRCLPAKPEILLQLLCGSPLAGASLPELQLGHLVTDYTRWAVHQCTGSHSQAALLTRQERKRSRLQLAEAGPCLQLLAEPDAEAALSHLPSVLFGQVPVPLATVQQQLLPGAATNVPAASLARHALGPVGEWRRKGTSSSTADQLQFWVRAFESHQLVGGQPDDAAWRKLSSSKWSRMKSSLKNTPPVKLPTPRHEPFVFKTLNLWAALVLGLPAAVMLPIPEFAAAIGEAKAWALLPCQLGSVKLPLHECHILSMWLCFVSCLIQ